MCVGQVKWGDGACGVATCVNICAGMHRHVLQSLHHSTEQVEPWDFAHWDSALAAAFHPATATDIGDGVPEAHAVPKGLAFHKSAPGLLAVRGLQKISLFDLTRPRAPCLSIGGGKAFDGVSGVNFRCSRTVDMPRRFRCCNGYHGRMRRSK